MHKAALVAVKFVRKPRRIARHRQVAEIVVTVNPARIRRIGFRYRQVVVPIPLGPLDLAKRIDALSLPPTLVVFEARRVPRRVGRADQLPLCVPLQLPHMAFCIRMARRLPILVPRPAGNPTELFGFKPGKRVYLSFDFRYRQIFIGPDFG
ncbi:hypothetical protein [Burkholderia aenigmatica]|uniref:hypothetical protein n=1 Tax=Burkholderia aenigmatica TaxID=2015348 RepID=UPI003CC8239B